MIKMHQHMLEWWRYIKYCVCVCVCFVHLLVCIINCTRCTVHTSKYGVIEMSLCTWWLSTKNVQKYFKQFQSLTMITQLEFGITDGISVSLVSNIWRLAGDTLNITCNFLYCNHQMHRDFLITLYYYALLMRWYNEHSTTPNTSSYENICLFLSCVATST
jgi:hypothetical protein